MAALAAQHGLTKVGERPPLGQYIRELWTRRGFLWTMSHAKSYAQNQNNYLGQLWTILSPLTLAAVYYLVFGLVLDTTDGTNNFPAFLVIGIFIFLSLSSAVNSGARSIINNIDLVRAINFPRAVLPISVAVSEMLTLLPATGVMLVIVIVTGEPITWTWLLVPVALALILVFTAGACLVVARIVVVARDLRNLIPVAIRLLRYVSGVFFSIQGYVEGTLGLVLEYQPFAVYLTLMRSCLMQEVSMSLPLWGAATGWAILFAVVGLIFFWGAEDEYGRD
ncbi:MAG TPA: ABC transporter permease [Candidatus Ruania gallistercoris]|uniref:Transport permease protein n=1 Tax=Candidatus Ruania gallistercoris TaxID=2838746 RepID=A0A9D2EFY8_9MICO|nr:ABC transporter permease [Candidatus Ruania gallistercoris]